MGLQVSGQTPGGAATFVGYRDRTPGLILDTPDHVSKDNHSLHTWLSASPTLAPMPSRATPRSLSTHQLASAATKQRQVTPQTASSCSSVAASGAGRDNLATPAAAEILKGLRIKTPQLGTSSTAALLRSSPFLAQLLRTAPAPSPASSQLADPASSVGAATSPSSTLTISRGEIVTAADFASPESAAVSSPDPLPPRAVATASMEAAGSSSPLASSKDRDSVSESECVTPVLSECAAESAIRQALVRLASSEKVIRLMSPVDLDAPRGNANPHATFTPATLSLPKFTLAGLDSPEAPTAALARQSSGSVNGPEDAALVSSPVSSQSQVVPIQAVVSQLLSSPKLAITRSDSAQDDKLPYQTLLQHLLGSGQAAANSPGIAPTCSGPAGDAPGPEKTSAHNPASAANAPRVDSTPAVFRPRAAPLVHPVVQATPARHRWVPTSAPLQCVAERSWWPFKYQQCIVYCTTTYHVDDHRKPFTPTLMSPPSCPSSAACTVIAIALAANALWLCHPSLTSMWVHVSRPKRTPAYLSSLGALIAAVSIGNIGCNSVMFPHI